MQVIRPLKKSFVIGALLFLLIGLGIECGGPVPSPDKMADQLIASAAKAYWKEVKEDVRKQIRKADTSEGEFEIRVEDKKEDFTLCGFTIEVEDTDPKEFTPSIESSSYVEEMMKDAEEKIIKEKSNKIKDEIAEATSEGKIDASSKKPPGFALKADGLYIWIVFFSTLISLIGMAVSKASVQRVGIIANLINSIIVIIISIVLIGKAILKLFIIFALLGSVFVAFLYPLIYEFPFPVGVILSLAGLGLVCKIISAILIWIGGSIMIKIKSFTLLLCMGFVTSIIIQIVLPIAKSILLASIADAVLGIIIAVIVIIWSIYILISAIRGLVSTTLT